MFSLSDIDDVEDEMLSREETTQEYSEEDSDSIKIEARANINHWRDDLLKKAITRLPKRERMIIKSLYGLNGNDEEKKTLREVGEIYNITRERIRQIEEVALKRLGKTPEILKIKRMNLFNANLLFRR